MSDIILPITVTPEIEKALRNASHEEMKDILHDAQVSQGIATRDRFSGDLIPVPRAEKPAASTILVQHTEVIGGREFTFTGETQAEVNSMILDAYKVAEAMQPAQPSEPVRDERGRFAKAEQVVSDETKAELLLKMQLGQISVEDYVEQSGAVSEYLETKMGIQGGVEAVKQTVAKQYEQSWADASKSFLAQQSDWPGGEKNKNLLGLTIYKLGLQDAEDKLAAMVAAYADMKREGLIFEEKKPVVPEAPKVTIDTSNMTPQEILDEWKKSAGTNPDAAFSSLFSRR
jgi:hypothetical protein